MCAPVAKNPVTHRRPLPTCLYASSPVVTLALTVNLGWDAAAAAAARALLQSAGPLHVRMNAQRLGPLQISKAHDISIPVFAPIVSERGLDTRYLEVRLVVDPNSYEPDVSYLDEAQLFGLEDQLYKILRTVDDYQVAIVGWNAESMVDTQWLVRRIADTGLERVRGIAVAEPLADLWGLSQRLEHFAPGYRWWPPARRPTDLAAGSTAEDAGDAGNLSESLGAAAGSDRRRVRPRFP